MRFDHERNARRGELLARHLRRDLLRYRNGELDSFPFPIGQISAFTCTVTTATSGIPMPAAGTIKNLRFVAGTGGKAGDAVTILKNGSATGMPTCTYGTATTCSDTSTSGSVAAGDTITVKIVTTTSDTTANVHVSFQLWN
jgi:hypothetical protein